MGNFVTFASFLLSSVILYSISKIIIRFTTGTKNYGDYETIKVNGKDYTVAWKSIESGRRDYIVASTLKDKFPDAIGFKTLSAQVPAQASTQNAGKDVWLTRLADGETEHVSAYVRVKEQKDTDAKEVEVGRLNVKSYDKVSNTLIVVPVNGAQVPADAAAKLNSIYPSRSKLERNDR